MRPNCQVLRTFQVLFVFCTDSFIGSTWASLSVLEEAKLGCHMYSWALGSQLSCFDGWQVLCSLGASWVKPSVTDFIQV